MVAFWDKLKFAKKPFGGNKPAPKTTAAPVVDVSAPLTSVTGEAHRVLIQPIVSERAAHLADAGQYCFEVATAATKGAVAAAVKAVYGIQPARVNIMRVSGKDVRFGGKAGRTKNTKKAIVTLPPGKRIKLFEGI